MTFSTDLKQIQAKAREHMLDGAVTASYGANQKEVCRVLNDTLATEIVCTLRYKRHYFMADGLKAEVAAAEFLEHAEEEQEHADRIAERIVQLGGEPDFNPDHISSKAHAEYSEGDTLWDMLKEDLVAERIAIDTYREMVRFFGDKDPTTRRMLEDILAQEEEHADDLAGLLAGSTQH